MSQCIGSSDTYDEEKGGGSRMIPGVLVAAEHRGIGQYYMEMPTLWSHRSQ